eukprot:365525-Chlamydomonas_euryale.AAC.5
MQRRTGKLLTLHERMQHGHAHAARPGSPYAAKVEESGGCIAPALLRTPSRRVGAVTAGVGGDWRLRYSMTRQLRA